MKLSRLVLVVGLTARALVAANPIPLRPVQNFFLISDSTGQSDNPLTSPIQGFGYYLGNYFTTNYTNLSRGGRSTRSFINEGLWASMLSFLTPNTFVVIQFGINDNGGTPGTGADIGKDRAVLPGIGPETIVVTNSTGQNETVRTFGSYLRQMVSDVKRADATPVLSGMDPLMIWSDDNSTLQRDWPFTDYAREVAEMEKVEFLDHTRYAVDRWQALGFQEALTYFPLNDSTHTNAAGALINAEAFVTAVKCQKLSLDAWLSQNASAVNFAC